MILQWAPSYLEAKEVPLERGRMAGIPLALRYIDRLVAHQSAVVLQKIGSSSVETSHVRHIASFTKLDSTLENWLVAPAPKSLPQRKLYIFKVRHKFVFIDTERVHAR